MSDVIRGPTAFFKSLFMEFATIITMSLNYVYLTLIPCRYIVGIPICKHIKGL